ncbi:hypothetical protein AB0M87_10150 [Streptomyces sp. NPDC051320]|uniref:hypothetical protein n=1 Tax=Streptomyces sp. NPDC051320 TaxID=3154644 RepID=UPI003434DBA6
MRRRRIAGLLVSVLVTGVWGWAVLRVVVTPGDTGPLESAVAAGGWGLSLLPIHVVAVPVRAPRR